MSTSTPDKDPVTEYLASKESALSEIAKIPETLDEIRALKILLERLDENEMRQPVLDYAKRVINDLFSTFGTQNMLYQPIVFKDGHWKLDFTVCINSDGSAPKYDLFAAGRILSMQHPSVQLNTVNNEKHQYVLTIDHAKLIEYQDARMMLANGAKKSTKFWLLGLIVG